MAVFVSVTVHPLLQKADSDRSVCLSSASGKMNAGILTPTSVRREPVADDCIASPFGSDTCSVVFGVHSTTSSSIALSLSLTIMSVLPESATDTTGVLSVLHFVLGGVTKFEICRKLFELLLNDLHIKDLAMSPHPYLPYTLVHPVAPGMSLADFAALCASVYFDA